MLNKANLAGLLCALGSCGALAQSIDWKEVGIEGNATATISYAIANTKTHAIGVVYLPSVLGRDHSNLLALALSGALRTPPYAAVAVSNASFLPDNWSSSTQYAPRGLVVSDSQLISSGGGQLKDKDEECVDQPKLAPQALLCVNDDSVALSAVEEGRDWKKCRDAMEVGRFLIHKGKPRECKHSRRLVGTAAYKTSVCVRQPNEVLLVMSKGVTVPELSAWMARMRCEDGAELARGLSAGSIFYSSSKGLIGDGASSAQNPAALLVIPRKK